MKCMSCGADISEYAEGLTLCTYCEEGVVDTVPWVRSVMFVGDYFSLISTVALDEDQRRDGESDEELAARIAGEFLLGFYGWDVAAASKEIGVADPEDLG